MVSAVNEPAVLAVAILFPLLDTGVVAARFYVRRRKKTQLGIDDWSILAALVTIWSSSIILITGAALGSFGKHTAINSTTGQDIITSKETYVVKLIYAYFLVMILGLGIVKVSVMLLYRRIFVGQNFNRYSIFMCVLIAAWCLAFFLSTVFQCGPRVWAWWRSVKTIREYCDDTQTQELVFAVLDIVTDLMVLITPLPMIWRLQMPRPQKLAVCGIFLLGLLSTAAALARMSFFIVGPFESQAGYRDLLAVDTLTVTWGQIEIGVAIIAACLPTLRPLFNGHSPESLIGSLRSKLSLSSLQSSKPRKSKIEGFTAMSKTDSNNTGPRSTAKESESIINISTVNYPWDGSTESNDTAIMQTECSFRETLENNKRSI